MSASGTGLVACPECGKLVSGRWGKVVRHAPSHRRPFAYAPNGRDCKGSGQATAAPLTVPVPADVAAQARAHWADLRAAIDAYQRAAWPCDVEAAMARENEVRQQLVNDLQALLGLPSEG